MARIFVACALLIATQGGASAQPRAGRHAGLFERLAGSWAGTGTGGLVQAPAERIFCRVAFIPAGEAQLHLRLDCASAHYKVVVEGDLSRNGDEVAGSLWEKGFGVSGDLAGTAGDDRLHAVVTGMGLSASLVVTLRGEVQVVTLQGLNGLGAGASVALRRARFPLSVWTARIDRADRNPSLTVFASEARQSILAAGNGSPRRCAPRNDG